MAMGTYANELATIKDDTMDRESLTDEEMRLLHTPSLVSDALTTPTTPNLFLPKQDPSLVHLHLEFASSLGDVLSKMTHRQVTARLRDEWLGTYSEFVFGQPVPTCCAVIKSRVHGLEFYLVTDSKILFPLLDRLLGSKTIEPIPQRPLSEIERTVSRLLIEEIVNQYAAAWQHSLSLDPTVDRIEHNLQQMVGLHGSETTYNVRYEVSFDGAFGLLELCLPWQKTDQIRQRLAVS